jgi:hypothetical protein
MRHLEAVQVAEEGVQLGLFGKAPPRRPKWRTWEDFRATSVGLEVFPLPHPTRQPKLHRAVYFLYDALAGSTPGLWPPLGAPTPRWSAWLLDEGERLGISVRTLREAKSLCLVDDRRQGFGTGSRTYWTPPRRESVRWVPVKWLGSRSRPGRTQ